MAADQAKTLNPILFILVKVSIYVSKMFIPDFVERLVQCEVLKEMFRFAQHDAGSPSS
jgi:hypothetical protein